MVLQQPITSIVMSVKPQGTQKKERQGSTRTATSVACSRPAWELKVHEDDLTTPSDRSSLPWNCELAAVFVDLPEVVDVPCAEPW